MMRKRSGFTVMEILLVVGIIGILTAVSIPIFAAHLDKARQSTCESQRSALALVISTTSLTDKVDADQDLFDSIYIPNKGQYACPKGGTFTWVDPTAGQIMGTIECSIHGAITGGEPGGGDPGGGDPDPGGEDPGGGDPDPGGGDPDPSGPPTYPGTDLTLEITDEVWPPQSEYPESWSKKTLKPSGIFLYEGQYYVITRQQVVNKPQAASGPGGEVLGWYTTEKLTGNIVTFAPGEQQKNNLSRGDLCKEGNDYYVFNDGGSVGNRPPSGQWYKIPK